MDENPLVGAWRLVSYQSTADDGEVVEPFGPDPVGYIIYTAGGYMSVHIVHADRPSRASDDITGGSDAERLAAVSTYNGYCGRYELHDDRVIHHVEPGRTHATQTISGKG